MAEVDDDAQLMAGDLQVIHHLAAFGIADGGNRLRFDDDHPESDEVRDAFTDNVAFLDNREWLLLKEFDSGQPEFDRESVLVGLLTEPGAEGVVDLHGTTHYPE